MTRRRRLLVLPTRRTLLLMVAIGLPLGTATSWAVRQIIPDGIWWQVFAPLAGSTLVGLVLGTTIALQQAAKVHPDPYDRQETP